MRLFLLIKIRRFDYVLLYILSLFEKNNIKLYEGRTIPMLTMINKKNI